jgi:hypothetical protein
MSDASHIQHGDNPHDVDGDEHAVHDKVMHHLIDPVHGCPLLLVGPFSPGLLNYC